MTAPDGARPAALALAAPPAGSRPQPNPTLAERAVDYLRGGPRPPLDIAREVLRLPQANRTVAERLVTALLGADPRFAFDVDGQWSAVAQPGLDPLSLADLRFAVVDVETTGMSARRGARMTEVAVVHVDGPRTDVAFQTLLNPDVPIPPRITALTGIHDAMVRDAPRFVEVADHLLAMLGGRVFVAHNARFDWAFVCAELERACGMAPRLARLCTVRLSRALVPELERRDLDTVRFFFGIETDQRHRAVGDALVTAAVLRRLLARAEEQGITTWRALKALVP
jgi:DNA polymerase III epsilon subunit family exonuclease